MSKKRLIVIVLIGAVFLIAFFLIKNQIFKIYSQVSNVSDYKKVGDLLLKQIEKTISNPPPLKHITDSPQSFLTESGVLKYTNEQRTINSLKPLIKNTKLDTSARLKVEEMFRNQYFEHVSPSGIGIGELAQQVDYEYIVIGENLAMGNFENSQKLVEAWMESPGHRENILNNRYEEIGIAVMQGTYQGEKIWMAVQHFARPMARCSKPNENLKIEILTREEQIQQLNNVLSSVKIELENTKPKTREEIEIYNKKVDEYNADLGRYNLLINETKNLINDYNNQIALFNACLNEAK